MKKILIIGGYGGFGKRLSKRLSQSGGWHVIIAGRNIESATKLSNILENCEPLQLDRDGHDFENILRTVNPDIVIDAAGPFQDSHYNLVKACIAEKIHYIDLADDREFVVGIKQFYDDACAAGVSVISGASSVPALSSAVVNHLIADMDEVSTIDITISASNKASAGASVAMAILKNIGKPMQVWRSKKWQSFTGWQMLRRESFKINNIPAMHRMVALVDVPDIVALPSMVKDAPSVVFRAGPELTFQTLFLWLLSWPVKWGWIESLSPLSKLLLPLKSLTSWMGSDASAMKVEVKGYHKNKPKLKRWTLIARDDDGPEIPTLPAEIIAQDILQAKLNIGAYHAGGLLKLDQFEPKFDNFSITTQIDEDDYTLLYRRVMGDEYDQLSPAIRDLHRLFGNEGAVGKAKVKRGTSFASKFVAAVGGFPPAGEYDVVMEFNEVDGVETWTRNFQNKDGHHKFTSHLSQSAPYIIERFGPMRFYFNLFSRDGTLIMDIKKWSIFSLPMPLFLAPRPVASESQIIEGADKDLFQFDVRIMMGFIGEVVHYKGTLKRI